MNKQDDIRKKFYELYNDIDRTAGLSKAKRKRLEDFRNQMSVDYYNLKADFNFNDETTFWKILHDDQINAFKDKYILYKGRKQKIVFSHLSPESETEIEDSSFFMYELIKEHKNYKKIVDKIINGKSISEEEKTHIEKKFYGKLYLFESQPRFEGEQGVQVYVSQSKSYTGQSRILNVPTQGNDGIYRALYEFIIILSRKLINVKQCKEPTCKNLYIPTARGHDQKYCSNVCKMRSYRRHNKKPLLDK
jgi:hypothetical protein